MNVKLDQIASIRTLMTFRDRAPSEGGAGNACVLAIRDIVSRWPPDFKTLPRVDADEGQLADRLAEGDILLPGRGSSYPARLFQCAPLPVFTAGQVFVIRARNDVLPAYLCWYLNRPDVQAGITQMLAGSAIQALNKSSLQRIEVALPPLKDQQHIAELQSLANDRARLRLELGQLDHAEIEHACETLLKQRGLHG
jgi:hypothetical protein